MDETTNIPELLDYSAAAQALHLSHYTLRRWVSEGKILHIKLGGRVFWTREMLAQIVASRTVEPVGSGR